MMELLLKICGLWNSGNETFVSLRAAAYTAAHPALLLVIGVLLGTGIIWLYRREKGEFGVAMRTLAMTCRILLVAMMLLILARPVLSITTSVSAMESLAVLFDTSSSMKIADARDTPEDKQRAAIAQGLTDTKGGLQLPLPGDSTVALSRLDIVKAAINNPQLQLPERLGRIFQVSTYTFDRQVADLAAHPAGPNDWTPGQASGSATALGDAIKHILVSKRGEALGGILVISDGGSNTGMSLEAAAKLARDEHVPVY